MARREQWRWVGILSERPEAEGERGPVGERRRCCVVGGGSHGGGKPKGWPPTCCSQASRESTGADATAGRPPPESTHHDGDACSRCRTTSVALPHPFTALAPSLRLSGPVRDHRSINPPGTRPLGTESEAGFLGWRLTTFNFDTDYAAPSGLGIYFRFPV